MDGTRLDSHYTGLWQANVQKNNTQFTHYMTQGYAGANIEYIKCTMFQHTEWSNYIDTEAYTLKQ